MATEVKRYEAHETVLGSSVAKAVRDARVLVVGAGGIGCELLKNLVMAGFEHIEVIDMDTIDLSNLNRQFLFRQQHIGQSKCETARDSALKFNPRANIVAHHGNVKLPTFGPSYFQQFNLVLNALDNLSARNHVNRLCLAADVPLVESGTAGFLGQVQVFHKDKTECFECQPMPSGKKSYASCTINNTPSLPIHCIVWAKWKFADYFGGEDVNSDTVGDDDLLRAEENSLNDRLEKGFASWLFYKLFHRDIFSQRRASELAGKEKETWKGRSPPEPLDSEVILAESVADETAPLDASGKPQLPDLVVWSLRKNCEVFLEMATKLKERNVPLSFDKDDRDVMLFVTAAANLRCHQFAIPIQSVFDAKALAGSIIPAIATTNAIISGLIVLEAIKILSGHFQECRSTYLARKPSGSRVLLPNRLRAKNPNCFVCSGSNLTVTLNTSMTLQVFVDEFLRKHLGLVEPTITVGTSIVYESGEDLEDDEIEHYATQAGKALRDLHLGGESVVRIEDNAQVLEIDLTIVHSDQLEGAEDDAGEKTEKLFQVSGDTPMPAIATNSRGVEPPPIGVAASASATVIADDNDLQVLQEPPQDTAVAEDNPRKRRASSEAERVEIEQAEEVVVLID